MEDNLEFKEYRKISVVKAKIFQKGDEDGFRFTINSNAEGIPFIKTKESNEYTGHFEENYLCISIEGYRSLVSKEIFEKTYQQL